MQASVVHTPSSATPAGSCPNVPPGRISVLLLKTPRADEDKQLQPTALRRLSEDDVPYLGSASLQTITWSIVSGFKGLENDVVILAGLTDIETDWHRGVAYVGMSRARTRPPSEPSTNAVRRTESRAGFRPPGTARHCTPRAAHRAFGTWRTVPRKRPQGLGISWRSSGSLPRESKERRNPKRDSCVGMGKTS
jgi:hypothetical protein